MKNINTIEDMKAVARRRVPKMFYDYVDSGSWTGSTYKANQDDFKSISLRQRVMVDIAKRNLNTKMIGHSVTIPVAIAPTGLTGMQRADGEILAAKAAESFGIPYTLSTMSICSIEDVAKNTSSPFWFQLYVMKDREFIGKLIDRAKAAGCSALVLTADLQIIGQRHNDIKNGLSIPPKPTLKTLINLSTKIRWCSEILRTKNKSFGNIKGHINDGSSLNDLSKWVASQFDPTLSWDDVKWIKERWQGPLIVKGIMEVDDARKAIDSGADAIIVSNHGGRQLDGALSSVRALPSIVDAVGEKVEIHMDGGIMSGQDVFKSLALGAKGVYIGRAHLYGLAAYGEKGVKKSLDIIREELDKTLALCGLNDIKKVDKKIIIKDW
ncbi:alpha-hydroxy acid oxidase [Halomonas sp. AOP35-4E-18]|uniref:alpha-hydroxy acid oxidase n=1 Tax=Halomonas sp. AOP35-4E-18 TaxID=3457686 RepID=UPI0040340C72